MEKVKSIVLLSGGLDSVTLAYYVATVLNEEVYGLIFNYGQPFYGKEFESAAQCIRDLRSASCNCYLVPCAIDELYEKSNNKNEYIAQRNLIFISYAMKYAEENGIKKIYIGAIDPEKPDGERYVDTSPEFVSAMNKVANLSGIEILAPFVNDTKWDVFCRARELRVDVNSTWSCNYPNRTDSGELVPCGKCSDCKKRASFMSPEIIFADSNYRITEDFKKAFMENPLEELRLYINNKCNMKCTHCYYGDNEFEADLSFEQFIKVIDEFISYGVKKIHFCGKEPFYDDYIFKFTDYIKEHYPDVKYDVVTNGVNVNKYLEQIENAGFYRVCVSFDDLGYGEIRRYSSTAIDAMKHLVSVGVETHAFITVGKHNVRWIKSNIVFLYKNCGVNDFFLHLISPTGYGENIVDDIVSPEELIALYAQLRELDLDNVTVQMKIKGSYAERMQKDEVVLSDILNNECYGLHYVSRCFMPIFELYCNKYLYSATVTSDGYVLGCALDTSDKNYRNNPNILSCDIGCIIYNGRMQTLKEIEENLKCEEAHECSLCGGDCKNEMFCKIFSTNVE